MEQASTFSDISKNIAKNFIQSVVAVDDQMLFDSRPVVDEAEELQEPVEDDSGLGIKFGTEKKVRSGLEAPETIDVKHSLYFQDLSSSFAQKGIVCSGFKPLGNDEETLNSIVESSKNSDVTILDWQMDAVGPGGSLAIDAICRLLSSDTKEGGRLRLVIVYTAETPANVLDTLNKNLDKFQSSSDSQSISFKEPELKFCKLHVISKDITEEKLSDNVIDLFATLTGGLLSNAALAAVSDIRDKTHNILYKFNRELDPAYVSHVLGLISSPNMREQAHEVAFDYAVELLSEEIKSELQISTKVKDSLSHDTLNQWPKYIADPGNGKPFNIKVGPEDPVGLDSESVAKLLTVSNDGSLKTVLDDLNIASGVFKDENIELSIKGQPTSNHLELSAIQCIRRDLKTTGTHIPVLKQGTIIKRSQNKYFICIQPLCDSVRLTSKTNFIFLRVSKNSNKRSFTHVLRGHEGEHLCLNVRASSKKISVYQFCPCGDKNVVRATNNDGKFTFEEAQTGDNFEWCGELKQIVAQEIVNSVSNSIARVGFDSFEWLRLKANQ